VQFGTIGRYVFLIDDLNVHVFPVSTPDYGDKYERLASLVLFPISILKRRLKQMRREFVFILEVSEIGIYRF